MTRQRTCAVAAVLLFAQAVSLSAAEPVFLGRTRERWVNLLESGQRRQRGFPPWAMQQFALEQLNPQNELIWLNELLLLAESSSPSARYWGAVGLGRMIVKLPADSAARAKACEALAGLLEDYSLSVRIAAADGLLPASDRQRALAVLKESLAHPQEAVRIAAATALEHWGEAARPAIDALQQGTKDSSEYVKRISTRAVAKLAAASR